METKTTQYAELLVKLEAMKSIQCEINALVPNAVEEVPLTIDGMNKLATLYHDELPNNLNIHGMMYRIIVEISDTVPEDIKGVKMLLNWWDCFPATVTGRKGEEAIRSKMREILPKVLETIPYTERNANLLERLEVVFPKDVGKIWWILLGKKAEMRQHFAEIEEEEFTRLMRL